MEKGNHLKLHLHFFFYYADLPNPEVFALKVLMKNNMSLSHVQFWHLDVWYVSPGTCAWLRHLKGWKATKIHVCNSAYMYMHLKHENTQLRLTGKFLDILDLGYWGEIPLIKAPQINVENSFYASSYISEFKKVELIFENETTDNAKLEQTHQEV